MKTIRLPGDKSISHRVALMAALAENPCRITNFNSGADCSSTLQCLMQLGAEISSGEILQFKPAPLRQPNQILDCGNSGSTIRMLTGLLAGQNIRARLTGDTSLLKRPMRRIADPLREMGAVIHLRQDEFAPIELIEGAKRPLEYTLAVGSAQVKSAILLAGLKLPGTRVIEKLPSRDHTERLLQHLNVRNGIAPGFDYHVPGDPSSAAFFVVNTLLNSNETLRIENLLINEHRIGYIRLLQKAGARIELEGARMLQNEPVGNVIVNPGGDLMSLRIHPSDVPSVIDEIPVLSLLGIRSGFEVHGANELRYKESDRIGAVTSNLKAMGIAVEEYEDGYSIQPGKASQIIARTEGDHRIAMTFAVAGCRVDDPQCVSISFPEFFDILRKI